MGLLKKTCARMAICALVVVVALIGSVLYLMHFALATPSLPRFAAPGNRAEANRQDLAYARAALHEMDRSFSRQEWSQFDRQIDEATQHAGQLDLAALEMRIAKAVAVSGNGHTNFEVQPMAQTVPTIPAIASSGSAGGVNIAIAASQSV